MRSSVFLCSYGHLFERGESLKTVIDRAAMDGFRAIEPFPIEELRTVAEAREIADHAKGKDLEVSCYSACFDLMAGTEADAVEGLIKEIDIAAALGSPLFHHTIYPPLVPHRPGDITFSDALKRASIVLKQCCAYATDHGVLCAFEDQGMYFNGIRGMSALINALGDTRFGLVADLGNILFVDECPETYIAAFPEHIVHVHCKDYLLKRGREFSPGKGWYVTRQGDFLRDTIVGHGVINYPAVMRTLKRIGYTGWYSLEYAAPEIPEYGIRVSKENLENFERMVEEEHTTEPVFHGVYPVFDEAE